MRYATLSPFVFCCRSAPPPFSHRATVTCVMRSGNTRVNKKPNKSSGQLSGQLLNLTLSGLIRINLPDESAGPPAIHQQKTNTHITNQTRLGNKHGRLPDFRKTTAGQTPIVCTTVARWRAERAPPGGP